MKFSDNTALLSLIKDPESDNSYALTDFVNWCDINFLHLAHIQVQVHVFQAVCTTMPCAFYTKFTESLLTFSFIC